MYCYRIQNQFFNRGPQISNMQTAFLTTRFLVLLFSLSLYRPAFSFSLNVPGRQQLTKMSTTGDGNGIATTALSILNQLNENERSIVLASGSPRRKELLHLLGIKRFSVKKSDFEEDLVKSKFPSAGAYCLATAMCKAKDVVDKLEAESGLQRVGTVLIGADTIVEINDRILEKPTNEDEAYAMVAELSGNWHTVHTGVIIFTNNDSTRNDNKESAPLTNSSSFVTSTRVKFHTLTSADIHAYVQTRDGMDKAGGYGIQSIGGQMVEKIDGCYFNVMGLPMSALSSALMRLSAAGHL